MNIIKYYDLKYLSEENLNDYIKNKKNHRKILNIIFQNLFNQNKLKILEKFNFDITKGKYYSIEEVYIVSLILKNYTITRNEILKITACSNYKLNNSIKELKKHNIIDEIILNNNIKLIFINYNYIKNLI